MKPLLIALLCATLSSCKAPSVNLATAEPIKVDIAMRLDVYQYSNTTTATKLPPKPATVTDPAVRRRNRMADIQAFKNERIVGETREGLVSIVTLPDGEYGDYVRKTVEAENVDRTEQMKDLAETRKTSLPEIQNEQSTLWRNRAFEGELIEVEIEPGTWKWTAKGS